MIDVWLVVQEISYPTTGPGREPMLRITHHVTHFEGGDCKFGGGLEVTGIFSSESEAVENVANLKANGVVLYDPPVPLKKGELPAGQRPTYRVFLMLEELHRRGYEQLRIVPGMSNTGFAYRASITPAVNVRTNHGALAVDDQLVAHTTSANGESLFGWDDAADASIPELARMFIRRFPKLAQLGRLQDPDYVLWFKAALACARRGEFPVAYDRDSFGRVETIAGRDYLPMTSGDTDALPMPLGPINNRESADRMRPRRSNLPIS